MLTVAIRYTRGSNVSAVYTLLLRVNITCVGTLRHEERNQSELVGHSARTAAIYTMYRVYDWNTEVWKYTYDYQLGHGVLAIAEKDMRYHR